MKHSSVQNVSHGLYWLASLALVGLPITALVMVSIYVPDRAHLVAEFSSVTIPSPVPEATGKAVLAFGFLPWLAALFVLWHMRALFQRYRRGDTLSAGCAQAIRRIGLGVLAMLGLSLASHSLQVLALTLGNPPGQRALSIAFDSGDVALALTGGMILVIGWVMGEAVRAAEENKGFI